jgi:adenylate cyclase
MKLPFRLTVLSVVLLLLGTTVLGVGAISYRNARVTAEDLASQMLEQTEARISLEIDKLLQQATRLSAATQQRVQSGRLRLDDFAALIDYLDGALEITDGVTGYFVGLETTGEAAGITRISGRPSIWRSRRSAQEGVYEVRQYWLPDYPARPFAFDPHALGADIRTRPWYMQALRTRRPGWTESFVFLGVEGTRNVLGVTHETPVYGRNGDLVAVLGADFELQHLCRFLDSLRVGGTGLAFVVEQRPDGAMRVIAHPKSALLVRRNPPRMTPDLIPPEEFPDARVRAFAAERIRLGDTQQQSGGVPRFTADGQTYIGTLRKTDPSMGPPWIICIALPEEEVLGPVHRGIRIMIVLGTCLVAIAVLLSMYLSTQVARPLESLAQEADLVGKIQLEPRARVRSVIREVEQLAQAMEDMKGGLRSFQKYVPADLVSSLLLSGKEASFGGAYRRVTIFFSDIAGFTPIAEKLSAEDLVEQLREYLNTVSQEIVAAGGTVDKYIGDAVMAFWGAPAPDPQHAETACIGALRCQRALKALNTRWEAAGTNVFRTRIGMHTGEVVIGNIGSDTRLNYTAIGDAVNLASRLEELNKYYGTEILISESTYQEAKASVVARPVDYVSVKGKRTAIVILELLGERSSADRQTDALVEAAERALEAYRRSEWTRAADAYEEMLRMRPGDPPAVVMLSRCRTYQATPPPADWDGAFHFDSK